jgi:hypothetical protein
MSNLAITSDQLDNLATNLKSLFNQMEKCYITICNVMGDSREFFDDDEEFWDWVENATPFKRRTAADYLSVHRNVLSRHGAEEKIKTMPFKALREIAKENVPKSVQNKVINSYVTAEKKDTQKPKLADVKAAVRESLGKSKPIPKPVLIIRKKTFAERLDYADKFNVAGFWLFDLPEDYCPETAALVVKHWKQKYHPDRGGDSYMFALLSEKANELEVR